MDRDIGGRHFGGTYRVCVMANEPRGVLYVGMTSDLANRRSRIAGACWRASRNAIALIDRCILMPLTRPRSLSGVSAP